MQKGRAIVALALLWAVPALGQDGAWKREAELNASLFFGNNSQRLAAARTGISHADSSLELSLSGKYTYADVESEGVRAVNRRSWDAGLSADLHPFARVSPFVFATVESSLEKQIELRYGVGGGAKYVFYRRDNGEMNLSIALLGEKTTPRDPTPDFDDELLARWSVRYKLSHTMSESVRFAHTTFYKPKSGDLADYTIASTSSLSVALNTTLSLALTFVDNYDSQATLRGAESNNDGQFLVGLRAAW